LREEFEMFRRFNPEGRILVLRGPGGVAAELPDGPNVSSTDGLDFSRIYSTELGIDLTSERRFAAIPEPRRPGPRNR
jgi:hypothetical protein